MLNLIIQALFIINSFAFNHSHSEFQEILDKYVIKKDQQTLVKYKDIKKSPQKLDSYLSKLSKVSEKDFNSWNTNQRLAFLINAYNAYTIKLIVNNYPLKSIRDIGSIFTGNAWKKKFFKLFGKKTHLDHIEHDLIRKKFKEPRIHFAVVCASMGCPNLNQKVYTDKKLDSLLEQSAKEFLNDPNKNKISKDKKTLHVSKIFKWYGDDFNEKFKNYESFIAPFMTQDSNLINQIKNKKLKREWLDYSWKLNEI